MKIVKVIYSEETKFILDIMSEINIKHIAELYDVGFRKDKKKAREIMERHGTKNVPLIVFSELEELDKSLLELDSNLNKINFMFEKLREGMFWVAGEIFNLNFRQVYDVPVFHPDVRVWEVSNKTTGKVVGLWYFDPYARKGKR